MKLLHFFLILGLFYYGCERPTETDNGDDSVPPGVPEGLRIYYASDGEIIIDWIFSREIDIKQYNIYRSTDSLNFILYDSSGSDYYFDDSLEYQIIYHYRISAKDFSGNESGYSQVVSAKPVNIYPPLSPQNLRINARNWENKKSIFLTWDYNNESDVTLYKIYRGDTEGFAADTNTFLANSVINEFEDTTASELYHFYYYKIKAEDKGGLEGTVSHEVKDIIFEEPVLLIPGNNSEVKNFRKFYFQSIGAPAGYKIIVQTNQYFGEIWTADIFSNSVHDTIEVNVPSGVFYYNTVYYWRVVTFSSGNNPNSISPLNKFIIKQ